ncbi:hypothetical protein EYC58_00645 [Candidatus Saccharibacteria bacterium]|nr:MAG: hypothetical protein EYC58_00645 [Candidatus Saccharibacteria bacterium]
MNIKANLKQMVGDRAFWAAWVVIGLIITAIIIIGAIYIRPSDLQVPVRYSGFGITHFYRDKWYYEIAFIVFALLVAVLHTFISARLLEVKGRQFALGFLWLTVVILAIAAVFTLAILRVAALSQ